VLFCDTGYCGFSVYLVRTYVAVIFLTNFE